MQITAPIKSSLCNSVKWGIDEGSLRGWFYLKVATVPENRELLEALKRIKEPGTHYFDRTGTLVARQWLLSKSEHRNLWLAKTKNPREYGPAQ